LGDRRNDGESNCNSGDGTGQMAQPWMFMIIMMMMMMMILLFRNSQPFWQKATANLCTKRTHVKNQSFREESPRETDKID
jgi:hypothetical protein